MYDLLLEDATVVSSQGRQVVDVAVEGGRFVYIGARPVGRARERVSAMGKLLIPGLVDTHVSLYTHSPSQAESCREVTRLAACGGVTTVLDVGYRGGQTRLAAALRRRLAAARRAAHVDFGAWALAEAADPEPAFGLLEEGAVGVQLLFDGTERAVQGLRRCLEAGVGPLVVVLAPGLFAEGGHREASAEAVRALLSCADEVGSRVHVEPLSSAEELRVLDPLRRDLPVTVGVALHHLALSEELTRAPQRDAPGMYPPLRTEADRRALWTAVRRGRVESVTSVHAAAWPGEPPGLPGLVELLGFMRAGVAHGRISLEQMVGLLCEQPAQRMGLRRKGRVVEGADADFVLFSEARLESLSPLKGAWSPFAGRELAPPPELVYLRGALLARSGQLVADGVRGRPVLDRGR